jgi:biopolymer transport protein ExbD
MNLRKKHNRASAEVHTSAMNDIMFFLLLFFLIASTVTNPNVIKLMLPKSSSGQAVSKKTITVSVTQDLKYYVEKKEIPGPYRMWYKLWMWHKN